MCKCSFCGKGQKEVKHLIAGGPNYNEPSGDDGHPIYICEECIKLINEVLEEREKYGKGNAKTN